MLKKKSILLIGMSVLILFTVGIICFHNSRTRIKADIKADSKIENENSNPVINEDSNPVIKVTKDQALQYIASKNFDGNSDRLSIDFNEKTKRYGVSWANPGNGTGRYWEIDSFNGDVYSGSSKFLANMLDSSKSSPEIVTINLKDGVKTNSSVLRTKVPINIDIYKSTKERILMDYEIGDFTGDGTDDIAYVISDNSNMHLKENINFIIQDGSNNRFLQYEDSFTGAFANIAKAKTSSKSKNDFIMHIDYNGNGGAGQYAFYIFSYDNGNISNKFYSDLNRTDFKITFLDGYKIKAYSDSMKYSKVYSLRFDLKKDTSRYASMYANDKLKASQESHPECINRIETKDTDSDGMDELFTYQYVSGLGRSDGLGELVTLWNYNGSKFSPQKCTFNIYDGESKKLDEQWYLKNDSLNEENSPKINTFLNKLKGCWFRQDFANNVIRNKSAITGMKNTVSQTELYLGIQFYEDKESKCNMSFNGTCDFHQGPGMNIINKINLINANTADVFAYDNFKNKDIIYRITIDTQNQKFNIKFNGNSFDYVGKTDKLEDTSFFVKQMFTGSFTGDKGHSYVFNSDSSALLNGEKYQCNITLNDDVIEFKKDKEQIFYHYEFKDEKLYLFKAIENPIGWSKGELYEVLSCAK